MSADGKTTVVDEAAVERVAKQAMSRTAGEVRFIKDRGSDKNEWGWGTPGPAIRQLDPDYKFDANKLEPLARSLRATLMALGHVQSAYNTFTKIKSAQVSPDGALGGKGYIQRIADMRRQYMNCSEALSSLSDTIYDEIHAPHWNPVMQEQSPRERDEVADIMTDVDEIKSNPEDWAADEEREMDRDQMQKKAYGSRDYDGDLYVVTKPECPDVVLKEYLKKFEKSCLGFLQGFSIALQRLGCKVSAGKDVVMTKNWPKEGIYSGSMNLEIHSGPFEDEEFIVNCYGTSVEENFMYLGRDSHYEQGPMELSCAPEKAVTFDFHHAYRDRLKESPVFPANSMGISKAINYLQKIRPEEFIKTAVDRVAGRYLQGNRA